MPSQEHRGRMRARGWCAVTALLIVCSQVTPMSIPHYVRPWRRCSINGRDWLLGWLAGDIDVEGRRGDPLAHRFPRTGIAIRIVGPAAALPISRDARRQFAPLYPLCAVLGPDLVVLATGSKHNKVHKAALTPVATTPRFAEAGSLGVGGRGWAQGGDVVAVRVGGGADPAMEHRLGAWTEQAAYHDSTGTQRRPYGQPDRPRWRRQPE
jgi:hypothetical protein